MEAERFEAPANGFVFGGLVAGEPGARPVLLLHGFPETSWSWRHTIGTLSAHGYRALAFDQRGYSAGARPSDVRDYRIELLVSDALRIADREGWERFDLVGHDWGGAVAWALAAAEPDRVRSLCVVSTPHPAALTAARAGGDEDQTKRSSYIDVFRAEGGVAERILLGDDGSGEGLRSMFDRSGLGGFSEDVDHNVEKMREPGALTAALNWYRAMSADVLGTVGRISVPTLYVWSTDDIALGRKAAEDTANFVSGPYRFLVLEGASHWIPETAYEELDGALLEHLAASS